MTLSEYFEKNKGFGVLATASSEGAVNAAVYARPHILDEQTIVFIMADRLSHANLSSNPRAAFLFREAAEGYQGKRLYLTEINEETDSAKIEAIRRRETPSECLPGEKDVRYLVTFRVDKVLPLIGSE